MGVRPTRYQQQICNRAELSALEPYVRLFRGAHVSDVLFKNHNGRPHRANLVDEYLETLGIERLP